METRRWAPVLFCCMVLACFSPGVASDVAAETIFNTENGSLVQNNPTSPVQFTLREPKIITSIRTYHYNNGAGASAGTISLVKDGKTVYSAQTSIVSRFYWVVQPNLVFPAGTYTITDSSPATWSWNSQSGNRGLASVNADPVPDDRKGAVAAHFQNPPPGNDGKGPVSLTAVRAVAAQQPYVVIDKSTIKLGETATVKLMNVTAEKRAFGEFPDYYEIGAAVGNVAQCPGACHEPALCKEVSWVLVGRWAGTTTIPVEHMTKTGAMQKIASFTLTVVP
jgi:hypothetical protein